MKSYLLVLVILPLIVTARFNNWDDKKCKNRCNRNDADRFLCTLDQLNDVTSVVSIPSGAPPTDNGPAYSQVSYSDTMLFIAGQNGYDSYGRLFPRDFDYKTGKSHSLTRIAASFLSVAAIMECFNMNMSQIGGIVAYITDTWNRTRYETDEQVQNFINERSLLNYVQQYFWGNENKMTRTLPGPYVLSRGDTFEVSVDPVPRINQDEKTCLETNKVPKSAQVLLDWTRTGNPPVAMDNFLFSKTGYHLGRGLGAASNPELRNDDWSRADLKKASRFGDHGDILNGENWNDATVVTRCVTIPERVDEIQTVPKVSLSVRMMGVRKPGQCVVFMMAGTTASKVYLAGSQNLLSRKCYTIAFDHRGHAESEVTNATVPYNGGFRYTTEVFADDIYALTVALNITERISFMGISIGGSTGLVFAARYPHKIDRLIPISAATQFRCTDFPNLACQPWINGTQGTTPFTMLPEDELSGCNVDNARAKINQNRQANTSGIAVTSLLEYAQKQDLSHYLPHIKAPTLIIYGTGDVTLGKTSAEYLHTNIVNSVRADFVNRGHLLPITSYVDVANIALRFIKSTSFPAYTKVLDTGCQVDPAVKPEYPFGKCSSV